MNVEKTEVLLRHLFDNEPLSDEDKAYFGLDQVDSSEYRRWLIRSLAHLIATKEKPSADQYAARVLRRIQELGVAKFDLIEPLAPSEVLEFLRREKYITRSISGYYLMERGQKWIQAHPETPTP